MLGFIGGSVGNRHHNNLLNGTKKHAPLLVRFGFGITAGPVGCSDMFFAH